jgi:hypothetical protein
MNTNPKRQRGAASKSPHGPRLEEPPWVAGGRGCLQPGSRSDERSWPGQLHPSQPRDRDIHRGTRSDERVGQRGSENPPLLADPHHELPWPDDSRSGLAGAFFTLPVQEVSRFPSPERGEGVQPGAQAPGRGAVRDRRGVPGARAPGFTPPPLAGLRRNHLLGSEKTLWEGRIERGASHDGDRREVSKILTHLQPEGLGVCRPASHLSSLRDPGWRATGATRFPGERELAHALAGVRGIARRETSRHEGINTNPKRQRGPLDQCCLTGASG